MIFTSASKVSLYPWPSIKVSTLYCMWRKNHSIFRFPISNCVFFFYHIHRSPCQTIVMHIYCYLRLVLISSWDHHFLFGVNCCFVKVDTWWLNCDYNMRKRKWTKKKFHVSNDKNWRIFVFYENDLLKMTKIWNMRLYL